MMLVPAEPTQEMIDAALEVISTGPSAGEVWRAFLSASPNAGRVSGPDLGLAFAKAGLETEADWGNVVAVLINLGLEVDG